MDDQTVIPVKGYISETAQAKQTNDLEIKYGPNPVSDVITIQTNVPVEAAFYSINGDLLLKKELRIGTNNLPTDSFPKGVVLLKITKSNFSTIYKISKI